MPSLGRSATVLALSALMVSTLGACGTVSSEDDDVASVPSVSAASDGGESASPAKEIALPAEFTAPLGEGLEYGEERVDESTPVAEFDLLSSSYTPARIAPGSALLDYDGTADYATQDPDWPAMQDFPDELSDAAMETASRFAIETWMDSAIHMENDPEANLAWFDTNKDRFLESEHESIRESLSSPGERFWVLGVDIHDPESTPDLTDIQPPYEVSKTRWTEIDVQPTLAIGAHGGETGLYREYAYVRYHVTANKLWQKESDGTPFAMPFEANMAVQMVRVDGSEDWKIATIDSNWNMVGSPLRELEHPWN